MKQRSVLVLPALLLLFASTASAQTASAQTAGGQNGGGQNGGCPSSLGPTCTHAVMAAGDPGDGAVVLDTGFTLENDHITSSNQDVQFARSCDTGHITLGASAQTCEDKSTYTDCEFTAINCGLYPDNGASLCGCSTSGQTVSVTLRVSVSRDITRSVGLYVNARKRPFVGPRVLQDLSQAWHTVGIPVADTEICVLVTLPLQIPVTAYATYQVMVAAVDQVPASYDEPHGFQLGVAGGPEGEGESESYFLKVTSTGVVTFHRQNPGLDPESCPTACLP